MNGASPNSVAIGCLGQILVADDDENNRLLLRDALEVRGHQVIEAVDGEQALRIASERNIDVVLLDVVMPKMDGFAVCRLLKRDPRTAAIPVLMVTSLVDRRERLIGMEAGANDFLTKPIDLQDVTIRVRNAVYTKRLFDQLENARQSLMVKISELAESNGQLQEAKAAVESANVQLKEARDVAEQASRAKSQFLASMSHELRTPLNAIIGFSEVLVDSQIPVDEATRQQFQENILNSGRHLLNLISDILDLSKVEAGKMELHPENFSVRDALQGVLAVVRPLAQKKHQALELDMDPAVTEICHDSGRFRQVLYNLLSNAVKFTPENGKITTTARLTEEGFLEVSVADTGIGLRPEDHTRIFEEFKQIDSGYARQQQGTGLGLALVRRFLRLMSGEIRLESQPGKGSTFTIRLPSAQSQSTRESVHTEPNMEGKPLILVVEDDAQAVSLLTLHLSRGGYQVIQAGNSLEALEKARTLKPVIITLDILLAKENGWEVLKRLKAESETREIPVIVISVVDDRETAKEAGAAAYLVKPVEPTLLVSTINSLAGKG